MEKVTITACDGYKLDIHVFKVEKEHAVVQIIHGMEEHQERYEDFIRYLNKFGYSVVSSDMRGHGKSADTLGFFASKEGYKELIEDQKSITSFIKENFTNLPVYLFAHSMGTIITRVLLEENSNNYQKVVLSGYPNFQKGAYLGVVASSIIKFFRGPKYKSKFLAKLSIDRFNKSVANPKTNCDWISKNEENVKTYLNDKYCGFGFTCSAYNDLYHLVIKMHNKSLYHNVNEDLEFLLLRGLEDPCIGNEKGAKDSYNVLYSVGFHKINTIDYPDCRHEILKEDMHQKIYQDILEFYNK